LAEDDVIRCPSAIVGHTLDVLRSSGKSEKECVVLWLADRLQKGTILEAYLPGHEAAADRFWVPPEEMERMMTRLRDKKLSLVAQVHSHPCEAFHSKTDDRYALVRYVGALSIVVPLFAQKTTPESFVTDCAFFALTSADDWRKLAAEELASTFEIY
jgi:proteasome lid subunit RPN8/RPN11